MKTMIHAALSSTFVLTAVLLGGCVAPDGAAGETDMDSDVVDSDVEMDEDLATASSALSDSQGLRSYSETQQNKPAISVDRGVGTIPSVCPSGNVEILGGCVPSGVAATCPSGKQMDAGLCYNPCPLGYVGVGPVCWIEAISAATCDALYSSALRDEAIASHKALTFGIGAGVAAGASVAGEAGVYYGENGEFGCYTTTCQGLVTNVSVSAFATFGEYDSVASLPGIGHSRSAGVSLGVVGYSMATAYDESYNEVGTVHQGSLGASLSPVEVGSSTCNTQIMQRFQSVVTLPDAPDGSPGNTFYRVASDGSLQMSHQAGNGSFDRLNQPIGSDWGAMNKVFAAEGGHVYAITSAGTLRYYHHDGAGNWDNWGTDIGWGWSGFTRVFAARFGEIYAIDGNGDLFLYRHDGALQFQSAVQLGSGWALPVVFSGGHGALYAIDANGNLLYYYHDENNVWQVAGQQIGTGWGGMVTVGSTGNGEIYAVKPGGELWYYRQNGSGVWLIGGKKIGWGWDFGADGIIPASY